MLLHNYSSHNNNRFAAMTETMIGFFIWNNNINNSGVTKFWETTTKIFGNVLSYNSGWVNMDIVI